MSNESLQTKTMSIVVTSNKPQKNRQQRKQRKQKSGPGTVQIKVAQQPPARSKKQKKPRGQQMSECASKYYASIARPFSTQAMGACLPFQPDRDSLKVQGMVRIPVTTASNGAAFVMFSPTLAFDALSGWYTTGAKSLPAVIDNAGASPNMQAFSFPTLPFSAADFNGNLVAGRVVSVGVRMTYTGSVSDMAGLYFSYADPEHSTVNALSCDPTGANQLLSNYETKLTRVSERAFEVGFTVVNANEHDYSGFSEARAYGSTIATGLRSVYPWSKNVDANNLGPSEAGRVGAAAPCIIVGVLGQTTGKNFYVEIIQHIEYVGKKAGYGLTPSHNDHNAGNIITAAADRAQAEYCAGTQSWSATMANVLKRVASEATSPTGKAAIGLVARVGKSYMSSRRSGALRLQ